MRKTVVSLGLAVALFCTGIPVVQAQDDVNSQIAQIKQQVEALQKQLDELQKAQAEKPTSGDDAAAIKSKLDELNATVTEPEGAVQTAISDVNKLKKIKVSGYVQARYESYQSPKGLADKADNKAPDNRFYVRRGRFKVTGQPTDNTVAAVQLDIAGYDNTKVSTKDLYLEFHPWGVGVPAPFYVRMGQQNWPFGYCIERSDSAAEVPERPKIFGGTTVGLAGTPSFNGLFPGERDRGVCMFSTAGSKVDWALGLFNGTGTKASTIDKSFLSDTGKFEDNNGCKTIVGRIRYPFLYNLSMGGSLYRGTQAVMPLSTSPSAVDVDQTRYGLDMQYYMQDASIKAEYVTGEEPYFSNLTTTPGTSGTNRKVSGWYVVGVKNLGPKYQAIAQYDVLDDAAMAKTFGQLKTWNLGLIRFLDDATKLKLFYEINDESKNAVSNNGVRVEVISVF